jgi:hypothetical protein
MEQELLFVPKTIFYYITTTKTENSGIFCQIAEFCGGTGGKTSPRPGNSAY